MTNRLQKQANSILKQMFNSHEIGNDILSFAVEYNTPLNTLTIKYYSLKEDKWIVMFDNRVKHR